MNTIYDYELSRSNEAVALRAKREDLLKKVSAAESAGREEGGRELEHYRSELQKVEEGQKKLKAAIFAKIKRAVESVAGRYEVDFILGAGEGVVYSRPVFDLTDDVIDELEKMNKNSSPVWK
jgi:Skp family chaperone for outer membrane proteins